jgi:hypothetical protein
MANVLLKSTTCPQLTNFLPSNTANFRTKGGVIVLYLF